MVPVVLVYYQGTTIKYHGYYHGYKNKGHGNPWYFENYYMVPCGTWQL